MPTERRIDALQSAEYEIQQADRDFVNKLYDRAEKNLAKAEKNWEDSAGYGSRAPIYRRQDQLRLCRLALQGASHQCFKCDKHYSHVSEAIKQYEDMRKAGIETVPISTVIDALASLY